MGASESGHRFKHFIRNLEGCDKDQAIRECTEITREVEHARADGFTFGNIRVLYSLTPTLVLRQRKEAVGCTHSVPMGSAPV